MPKGIFITFEGIDGCGKSTQLSLLREYLESRGMDIVLVREPGGTAVGEKIREILLDRKNDTMVSTAEILLYEAARAQITEEVIRPALLQGKAVICDRFFDSASAYQGHARGLGMELVGELNKIATGGLEPDITFLLDILPREALLRRKVRGEAEDRLEALGLSFQEKVREGYLALASGSSGNGRIRIIDASCSMQEIADEIRRNIDAFLGNRDSIAAAADEEKV